MKTIETNLATTAVYSDDGRKKYLIRKTWDVLKTSIKKIKKGMTKKAMTAS